MAQPIDRVGIRVGIKGSQVMMRRSLLSLDVISHQRADGGIRTPARCLQNGGLRDQYIRVLISTYHLPYHFGRGGQTVRQRLVAVG